MLPDLNNQTEWQMLLDGAFDERLAGFYFSQLRQLGVEMPPVFAHSLKHQYLHQWQHNERLLREIGRISSQLNAANIRHLFYKGPLFAQQIYPHLGCRDTSDIDLMLTDPADVSVTEQALAELGYTRQSYRILPLAITQRAVYEFEYQHPDFDLDVHWSLQKHPSLKLEIAKAWETRRSVDVVGETVQTFSAEYTLLAYALSLSPDISNNALKLRYFLEIALLLRQMQSQTDWERFWQQRTQENTVTVTYVLIAATTKLFDDALGRGLPPSPTAKMLNAVDDVIACLMQTTTEKKRKMVAFSLFDSSLLVSAVWWLGTLAVRAVNHPEVTNRRLNG
ncbi:nucleotidyltransferase family protein [Pseudomonadota bacterium]